MSWFAVLAYDYWHIELLSVDQSEYGIIEIHTHYYRSVKRKKIHQKDNIKTSRSAISQYS